MEFFKKLFSGGGAPTERGLFYYVKPTGCTEIVRIRVDTMNEISQNDDGNGYFVKPTIFDGVDNGMFVGQVIQ